MSDPKDDFIIQLLATFRVEAAENIAALASGLLALERAGAAERPGIIERIFREAHSLKGAARAVNLADIESVCHALESLFADWKAERLTPSAAVFDLLHESLDFLSGLLSSGPTGRPRVDAMVRRLESAAHGRTSTGRMSTNPPQVPPREAETEGPAPVQVARATVRIQAAKLDSILRQTEDLLGPRLAGSQRVAELRATHASLVAWRKERDSAQQARNAIERALARGDSIDGGKRQTLYGSPELSKVLEHIEAEGTFLKDLETRVGNLEEAAEADRRALSGIVGNLLHDVKETLLLPFTSLFETLPRVVRDLARDQSKEVEVVTRGGEIEIDRRILEEMKAPLQHLVRNSIDHGIEPPEVREKAGKPRRGTLTMTVSHSGGNVEIDTSDDGAGIDTTRVGAAAEKLGIIRPDEAGHLTEREVLATIFRSGLTTSPIITEISGRGLGLAIVREKVDRLGGSVFVESAPGTGTTVRIVLPLSLATIRGVLVRAGDQRFIVPVAHVVRVARVSTESIRTVENRETVVLDGLPLSLVRLDSVLELARPSEERTDFTQVLLLGSGEERIAFQVDEIVGEEEALVKGLGPQLARVRNIAGASVLGTGAVVPVLNVPDLLRSALRPPALSPAVRPASPKAAATKRSVLVVEDSITSRTLLKNILESAGYDVGVAVDGIDAVTSLRTRPFDLVVSDVEMPRMNGFDLTAKIRGDSSLSALPVVLVTALESREDRERGIDVGASAYLVKSSFDQSNLLDVVRRLVGTSR